jgi:hypothetical protein
MAICGCVLPACCCQPAVAGSVIYADLGSELNTHLAPQALFTQSSLVHELLLQAFPFLKHTGGGDTAPAFSGLCVYLQFMLELGLSPSPVEFSSLHHSHKLSHSWLLGAPPLPPEPLWPGLACLFTVPGGNSSELSAPHPLCYMSLFLLLITQFLFFSLGGGQSVQGAMLIWPRVVCGSIVYHLAHLVVCVFPSRLGPSVWRQPKGLPGFSV